MQIKKYNINTAVVTGSAGDPFPSIVEVVI